MKNILITGATGFIGGFLVDEALAREYKVFATVRKSSNLQYLQDPRINKIAFDFTDPEAISEVIVNNKISVIINNAGLTRSKDQSALDKVNATYLDNLCQGIKKSNTDPFLLHISSLAALGPAEYTKEGIVDNGTNPHPVTMYGKSKLKGENILRGKYQQLRHSIMRPTAVYGPREKDLFTVFKTIKSGIEPHIGSGNQELTFIYVKDLVSMMMNAADLQQDKAEYLAGDGHIYSGKILNKEIRSSLNKSTLKFGIPLTVVTALGYVSEYAGKLTGTYPTLNIDKLNEIKAQSWRIDAKSTHEALGYEPKYKLAEGIKETTAWYLNNKWL